MQQAAAAELTQPSSNGSTAGLHHEAVDAQAFADWGFDFIKHGADAVRSCLPVGLRLTALGALLCADTCAETKPPHCGIHDGCMQNSTAAMRAAIDATGRRIVYYVDSGNPTSPQMLYNPQQMGVAASDYVDRGKLATSPRELAWVWLRGIAHVRIRRDAAHVRSGNPTVVRVLSSPGRCGRAGSTSRTPSRTR